MDDNVAQAIRTFRIISQTFEPRNVVLNLDELSEMEIRPNVGASCRRLVYTPKRRFWKTKPWKRATSCLPNEDFRWPNETFDESFRTTFQVCEYSIWANIH